MPKSLTRTADVDVFDYGKAVTLILSTTKELNKTRNTLVDDITYLESRKKQEAADLEKVIAKKAELLKLNSDLTEKIIASKSAFMAEVSAKKEEIGIQIADLAAREALLADNTKKLEDSTTQQRNELKIRSDELEKATRALAQREATVAEVTTRNAADKTELIEVKTQVETLRDTLVSQQASQFAKAQELTTREAAVKAEEAQLVVQQTKLADLATNLEGQVSLVESEKNKNRTDVDAIRDMQKVLYDKQLDLNNRETKLVAREAGAAAH